MTASPTRFIALPWYRREDYARLRSIIVDSYSLAPTYAQWLMVAESNEAVAHRSGIPVKRVIIEPETFARWCENQGVPLDGRARMLYAQQIALSLPP